MKPEGRSRLIILIPVYNDWESASILLIEIEQLGLIDYDIFYVAVNDSSEQEIVPDNFSNLKNPLIILELSHNMGHQKAIAAGLSYINEQMESDITIVLDSDGEDRPEDILRLLKMSENFDGIIFAQRTKRSEGFIFRIFYWVYKFLFNFMTGKSISFGNFSLIPKKYLSKMVHLPVIWNHFSGSVIRSNIPYTQIPTTRGKRYRGESKMNFIKLTLHGLSAISVYADFMAVRLIMSSLLITFFIFILILLVAIIRLFTNLAIPGWASFIVLGLIIILFLILFLGLFLIFNLLNMKTQKMIIPAKDYQDYLIDIKKILPHE